MGIKEVVPIKQTEVLQEILKMHFIEAYGGWQGGRLTQAEAAQLLGVCERAFRRYILQYEEDLTSDNSICC
jgi:hypothetical protein